MFSEMTAGEIEANIKALAEENVSVIEADSDLSRYLSEKEFEAEIAFMRTYATVAHRFGLKVLWYYPVLEVLSPGAKSGKQSMYKAHPTWVQRGLDGTPNVFYGAKARSATRVHWADIGMESAWMSPHSEYAQMFLDRVKKVAATGVDGIWLDVPIYNDIAVKWADTSPMGAAKFHADTGMDLPKRENWNDPAWRRWIAWRHAELSTFLIRAQDAAKSVKNDIAIVVENATLDHAAATVLGLDGSSMKTVRDMIQVWEVDTLSDATGMSEARPDDWLSLIGMSKFAKGASGEKPSWMFTYGRNPDDALLVMAEALASGNNPYETKIPQMGGTVGASYRKLTFSWIERQEKRLFASQSAAKVAVYYSPESRDYVDHGSGSGLFTTTKSRDDLWWSNDEEDSLSFRTYLAEYRGIMKWFVRNHVPFDVIVHPDASELSRYELVMAPLLTAISEKDSGSLEQYLKNGGTVIVTGANPAALDEFGNERSSMVGLSTAIKETESSSQGCKEKVLHTSELLGKSYLTSDSSAASNAIHNLVRDCLHPTIRTNADGTIHIEARRFENELLLHLIDPERLWKRTAIEKHVMVSAQVDSGHIVSDVEVTSPMGAGADQSQPETERVPFTMEGNYVSFRLPVRSYQLVVISTNTP